MNARRLKRNYDGTDLTTRHVGNLLSTVLSELSVVYKDKPELVVAAWPGIVGPTLAPMTQPQGFVDGVLTVRVKNSTLYSLLSQYEKQRLLGALRSKFPHVEIRNIVFRVG